MNKHKLVYFLNIHLTILFFSVHCHLIKTIIVANVLPSHVTKTIIISKVFPSYVTQPIIIVKVSPVHLADYLTQLCPVANTYHGFSKHCITFPSQIVWYPPRLIFNISALVTSYMDSHNTTRSFIKLMNSSVNLAPSPRQTCTCNQMKKWRLSSQGVHNKEDILNNSHLIMVYSMWPLCGKVILIVAHFA